MSEETSERTTGDWILSAFLFLLGCFLSYVLIFHWHEVRSLQVIGILHKTDVVTKFVDLPVRKREQVTLHDLQIFSYMYTKANNTATGEYEFVDKDGRFYILDFCPVGAGKYNPDFVPDEGTKGVILKELTFERFQSPKSDECVDFVSAVMNRKAK